MTDQVSDVEKAAELEQEEIVRPAVEEIPAEQADVEADAPQKETAIAEKAPLPEAPKVFSYNAKGEPRMGPDRPSEKYKKNGKLQNDFYEAELTRLQEELVKVQYWVKEKGLRVVVLFEGRDAAGKGGAIKRITERMNPRIVKVVALAKPTEREKTEWYFQRYVAHLPAAGEIVLFDRSWYTRAVTEYVMGFCDREEYWRFMRNCPQFERMLVRDGIILVKYWFSVSDKEQERRFQTRANDPRRRWKLSPIDLEARHRWEEFSKAKDQMFEYTDTKIAPWYVVNSDDKKRARLNCVSHLLSMIEYEDILPSAISLPPRKSHTGYVRMPYEEQTFVPEMY